MVLTLLSVGFAFADSKSSDKFALNFSLFNFGENREKLEEKTVTDIADNSDDLAINKEPKNSCEHIDNVVTNILNLQDASDDTKQKIEKVEETIEDETTLRDSILGSVKDFLGLQKKDKTVFGEMKKDLDSAKGYYTNLDEKILDKQNFIDENPCENLKLQKAKDADDDTQTILDVLHGQNMLYLKH
jgi:hypothetical protein